MMTESILRAAVWWIQRGLPLKLLKIVVQSQAVAAPAGEKFVELQRDHEKKAQKQGTELKLGVSERRRCAKPNYDVFLSYCHDDSETASVVKQKLETLRPGTRILIVGSDKL